ncbi:MAG: endonuclease domain-containing protein [Candidatus Lambdaproteobacteria bacterium]|nr:endonuclease domain-containing protein [Candidatus Lambdaproteobacteria bacterium]
MRGEWRRSKRTWAKIKPEVLRLRQDPTRAEAVSWEYLRADRFGGAKFRRQHPIGHFIVDFCCPASRLVVELDGPVHDHQREEDRARQDFLESRGYRVLRLRNEEVLPSIDAALDRIRASLAAD